MRTSLKGGFGIFCQVLAPSGNKFVPEIWLSTHTHTQTPHTPVYLLSPFPRFPLDGFRTVWFPSMSTTHFVFKSRSVKHTLISQSEVGQHTDGNCIWMWFSLKSNTLWRERYHHLYFIQLCLHVTMPKGSWMKWRQKQSHRLDTLNTHMMWHMGSGSPLLFMGRTRTATFTLDSFTDPSSIMKIFCTCFKRSSV